MKTKTTLESLSNKDRLIVKFIILPELQKIAQFPDQDYHTLTTLNPPIIHQSPPIKDSSMQRSQSTPMNLNMIDNSTKLRKKPLTSTFTSPKTFSPKEQIPHPNINFTNTQPFLTRYQRELGQPSDILKNIGKNSKAEEDILD